MPTFRVELRAWPDTPREEEYARREGRALGPQTVVYPEVHGETREQAIARAIDYEMSFVYRRHVVVFNAEVVMQLGCDCCGPSRKAT